MPSTHFSISIKVHAQDIDQLGHVNNVVYLQWVQEVAAQHWKHKVSPQIRESVYWVVLDHAIHYKKPAFEGEELLIKTRVASMKGVRSERHTEIWRKKDHQLLVKAETMWCLMSADTHRPKRITPEIEAVFL